MTSESFCRQIQTQAGTFLLILLENCPSVASTSHLSELALTTAFDSLIRSWLAFGTVLGTLFTSV